ncbi:MAG TPA: DUF2147 domain-containing protein, partial [Parachlamydiaceae bacterium]|nr:DUF2147 domain-containing protein [Parachlamydiaceae bacterium]
MKIFKILGILFLLICSVHLSAEDKATENDQDSIIGFWKTIDEKSQRPESVVAIYKYNGIYYGRIILTYNVDGTIQDTIYNPKKQAAGVVGNPYYVGMDIMWGLKQQGKKYKDGSILDPEKGNVYGAEAWRKAEKIVVRGKLFIFGRN